MGILQKISEENTQLLNMSEALECDLSIPQYVYEYSIRLVASKVHAGNALVRSCSALREHIGNMAGEEAAVAETLLGKLKVVQVCNYSSLPDRLTGTLPCLSEKSSDSRSGGLPCKESSSLFGIFSVKTRKN
jgi:hypothetical protein